MTGADSNNTVADLAALVDRIVAGEPGGTGILNAGQDAAYREFQAAYRRWGMSFSEAAGWLAREMDIKRACFREFDDEACDKALRIVRNHALMERYHPESARPDEWDFVF